MFHSCPPNIYARHGEKVSWKKPLVTDNVGVKVVFFLSPGISNNSVPTTPGIHFLQYAASDWQGNKAYCNFRIQVYKTGMCIGLELISIKEYCKDATGLYLSEYFQYTSWL